MKTLFDKTQLGQMYLKNRFIRSAIGEKTSDGKVNKAILKLYKELAQGGVGTLITSFTLVDEAEKNYPVLAFYDDSFHKGHKELTTLVHENNVNIILQLGYLGSDVMGETTSMAVLAPSAVANLNSKVMPQEITVTQIKNIQEKFAKTALRAKNAGYDGIEIHAAHGCLLSQFMTPYYNQRTDLYGGSAENRARMALETYQAIRESAGTDFPIFIKINVTDGFENGVSFGDVLYLCKELTRNGMDAIEISGDWSKFPKDSTSFFESEAEKIASENETKIILTGGNKYYGEMEKILNKTNIEYFGMARSLAKEPDLINQFKKKFNNTTV